ncbi:hypothetical protein [Allorhizocola rhizosphaerae]|uniref:hypothetical protein n=1 Tax=Allorhizocola rhizosphaerae TaxID=1872709 RepID=UPI000E3DC77C|nr:hypothetical protein [Allorhizocola rhizosphaerae]
MNPTSLAESVRLAASLQAWLGLRLSFVDRDADQITELVTGAVVDWGRDSGWRVYRKARSVFPLPPPYQDRHSFVDVGIARAGAAPIVVEVDRSDRKRTLEKLAAEAAAGRVALWVRWGTGPFTEPMPPVLLVPFAVEARRGRVYSTPIAGPPAPEHSAVDVTEGEQAELFGE